MSTGVADLLRFGAAIISKAHGQQLAKVVSEDVANHPAAAAQAMAHLASAESLFRDTLAGHRMDPDEFALALSAAVRDPNSHKTPLSQMAEIFA